MRAFARVFIAAMTAASSLTAMNVAQSEPRHGISMYGKMKYPANFTHFDYVNPNAPKGGSVRLSAVGTYDTLNPFVIKGVPAAGILFVTETLLAHSYDEPFSLYGALAQTVETPKDRSWVSFKLWDQARWHDGVEVTADDIIFSFDILRKKGMPLYRQYYANVAKAEKTGPKSVKFHFSGPKNQELPLIVGELVVLPKHYWEKRDFTAATLEPPIGSGHYRVDKVQPGRFIEYQRVKDYWGKDVPSQKGTYNFDRIRFDYYRDRSIAFEAFKSGQYDYRSEATSKIWATGYNFPAIKSGLVKRETWPTTARIGTQGLIFNLRRKIFSDRRVRAALAYAYDFEWTNKNLQFGLFRRNRSYFDNSELAATGLPSADELKLLQPLKADLPPEVFTKAYDPPSTKGKGGLRRNLRTARKMLQAAGWQIKNGVLTNKKSGKPFEFSVLTRQPISERTIAPFIANLKRLGIRAKIRLVDSSQYVNRVLRERNFDMISSGFGQSNSPGNEQRLYWHSNAAKQPGSRNHAGISNPAIDKLIDHIIFADSRMNLVTATRALDRALQWGHYTIPTLSHDKDWIAYWDRFARPKIKPELGVGFSLTWWIDPAKDAALKAKRNRK